MEQTPEDKEFLHANRPTSEDDKAESLKMVEVVNLLQDNLVRTLRLMWCQLFFIGALILFLFVTYFSLLSKIPSANNVAATGHTSLKKPSSNSEIVISPQIPQTQQSIRPTDINEREEVQGILDQVRKAQLEKDINLFLQAYSPTYPNLAEKKESLLNSWKKYNYLDMNFNIVNLQKKSPNTLVAEIASDITLEDIHSKKKSTLSIDYNIYFTNLSGKWLIQGLTEGEKNKKDRAKRRIRGS